MVSTGAFESSMESDRERDSERANVPLVKSQPVSERSPVKYWMASDARPFLFGRASHRVRIEIFAK